MDTDPVVTDLERELRALSHELVDPRERECLLCYVHRMLALECSGLRWATRYRDLRAPRATDLEGRLGQVGGFCDCEIFLNGYQPAPELWTPAQEHREGDRRWWSDPEPPERMPPCLGVRRGSTQGCALWVRQRRRGW